MKKIAIVSFNGEMSCFAHALLNVWNYHQKGYDIKKSPQANLWTKIVEAGLVRSVCKACAAQLGSLEEAEAQGLPIDAALSGHSDLEVFTAQGYEIILF